MTASEPRPDGHSRWQRATPGSWSKSALRTVRYRGAPSADNDALSQAMAMVAVPVFFGFLGFLLDGQLGTGWVFVIVFAAFGVACSFASAYHRYERRMAQHDDGKPWSRGRNVARRDPAHQEAGGAVG